MPLQRYLRDGYNGSVAKIAVTACHKVVTMNDGVFGRVAKIGNSAAYWVLLLVIGLCFESVALYYQYVLELQPCVLCIQVRIWVMALILVALVAFWMRR